MLTPIFSVQRLGAVKPMVKFFRRRWSVGRRKRVEYVYVFVGSKEGSSVLSPTCFLDLIDVVVLGDSQVQHFFVTVLVERGSVIVEVATEGVAEGEVDVDARK